MAFARKDRYTVEDLRAIMELLRGENGCPWDREQTHESIRGNLLEEAYEVADAIDQREPAMLCEELGDLLLQVVFHSRMSEEAGGFDLDDVATGICKKLILRHPHIFGNLQVDGAEQVLDNWEEIKKKEKGQTTALDTLRAVPAAFPALMRSQKVQKRAGKAGFDYPNAQMALSDLESELAEFKEAMARGGEAERREELGDLLFSCVNVGRKLGLDAEESLAASCQKFIGRFARVEALANEAGLDMKAASLEQLDGLWRRAKKELAAQ